MSILTRNTLVLLPALLLSSNVYPDVNWMNLLGEDTDVSSLKADGSTVTRGTLHGRYLYITNIPGEDLDRTTGYWGNEAINCTHTHVGDVDRVECD